MITRPPYEKYHCKRSENTGRDLWSTCRTIGLKRSGFYSPLYRPYIEATPFVALATYSADGMDVSPRGDEPGFIHIEDDHTLLLPDRRGNNRIDSMRNLLINPAIALLVLVLALMKHYELMVMRKF